MENTKLPEIRVIEGDVSGTPSGIDRSRHAFYRDLPALLANPQYNRWCAAYCGDERIGIDKSSLALYEECKRRGLQDHEFFIGCISPFATEEVEEIDTGFFEFEEIEDNRPGPAPAP